MKNPGHFWVEINTPPVEEATDRESTGVDTVPTATVAGADPESDDANLGEDEKPKKKQKRAPQ